MILGGLLVTCSCDLEQDTMTECDIHIRDSQEAQGTGVKTLGAVVRLYPGLSDHWEVGRDPERQVYWRVAERGLGVVTVFLQLTKHPGA